MSITPSKNKTVLLTGVSGYIGKHVALQLLNQGYNVRASVRNLQKTEEVRKAILPHLSDASQLDTRLTFVELDLEKDAGWSEALTGMDVLMHTASPFPIASPKDENILIKPAVEGTLRALKAAHKVGVKRVILTSSIAAIYGTELPEGKTAFDESIWTDINHPVGKGAYVKSKTLAEKAAWDYIKNEAPEMELTVINPALVLGAPLDHQFGSSVSLVQRILVGSDPMLPDLQMFIVDVKDVAKMHVNAIEEKNSIGQRVLGFSEPMTFVDIAKLLKSTYPEYKVKTTKAPSFLIRLLALFNDEIKVILPLLGDRTPANNAKAKSLLHINFTPAAASVKDTADYLIKNGFAGKNPK